MAEPLEEMSIVFAMAIKANLRGGQEPRSLLPENREFFIAARFMRGAIVTRQLRNRPVFLDDLERETRAFDPRVVERALQQVIHDRLC
jgi:hypothetical protein